MCLWMQLAATLVPQGQKAEAEKYYLRAIQLDPTKGNCYMHYGQFLLELSRLEEAAAMAERAAELDSGEFDVVFSAAHMLSALASSFHIKELTETTEDRFKVKASQSFGTEAWLMESASLNEAAERQYERAASLRPD
ncbi:unnamed protein product, partial [Arctogadus glacialis]